MKGIIIALFIIGNILLTGCGGNQTQTQTKIGFVESPKAMTIALQMVEVTLPKEEETVPDIESIADANPVSEAQTIVAPAKKIRPIVKKEIAIVEPVEPQITVETPTVAITEATIAPIAATKPVSNWQPNEVHLIRGTELINGLQRDLGRKPNAIEMQQRLQSHMGLSDLQAQQVISHLSKE